MRPYMPSVKHMFVKYLHDGRQGPGPSPPLPQVRPPFCFWARPEESSRSEMNITTLTTRNSSLVISFLQPHSLTLTRSLALTLFLSLSLKHSSPCLSVVTQISLSCLCFGGRLTCGARWYRSGVEVVVSEICDVRARQTRN